MPPKNGRRSQLTYNSSFGKENAFSEEFKQMLRLHGAYATSVIGSLYASGQPDIDCCSIYGQNTKIELKIYRGVELPTRDTILKLLRGPQRNVILHQMFKRNVNCLIVAQIGAKPDTCCIVSATDMTFDKIEALAIQLARLKYGARPTWTTSTTIQ